MSHNYEKTVNIPQTDFLMKADLYLLEPRIIEKWHSINLYKLIKDKKAPKFVMHYGPPYLNGDFHIGHGVNMILKDTILRSQNLLGYAVDILPGFDCHGLPIELKAQKNFTYDKSQNLYNNIKKLRETCAAFNDQYLPSQLKTLKRTGMLLSSSEYYMTRLNTHIIYKNFSQLLLNNKVILKKKPVIWSISEETTIADSEVIYKDKISHSIYFILQIQNQNLYVVCWTTTPWTLVDNTAVAYNPNITYCIVTYYSKKLVIAKNCIQKLSQILNYDFKDISILENLENIIVSHPIKAIQVPLIISDHVIESEGTGFVHIAPAHGPEDYELMMLHNLQMIESTNGAGYYIENTPLENLHIFNNEPEILEAYKNIIIFIEEYHHSYPYSQRTDTPLIYRATEQIFINIHEERVKLFIYNAKEHDLICDEYLDNLDHLINFIDNLALVKNIISLIIFRIEAIGESNHIVKFTKIMQRYFDYHDILSDLIEHRTSDYFKCNIIDIIHEIYNYTILKQKCNINLIIDKNNVYKTYYKLPKDLIDQVLKIKTTPDYLKYNLLEAINNRKEWCVSRQRTWGVPVALFIHKHSEQILVNEELQNLIINQMQEDATYFLTTDCINILKKIKNLNIDDYRPYIGVLDVWFDSGCVFNILDYKVADIYCEGKDQVRGWFQSSLWISYLNNNTLPYKSILSHGFVLDAERNKMSKSQGNVKSYNELLDTVGRDILNIWLMNCNYTADIKFSNDLINKAKDTYRRIRNVLRYLISVSIPFHEKLICTNLLEKHYLYLYKEMENKYLNYLRNYEYKEAFECIYLFILDISSQYFNARKDSLYNDLFASTIYIRNFMYFLLHNLIILLTPFLPFTTEEIAEFLKYSILSIHLYDISNLIKSDEGNLLPIHDICVQARKLIDNIIREESVSSSDIILEAPSEYIKTLEDILKVSKCIYGETIKAYVSPLTTCERCFKRNTNKYLCTRCSDVLVGLTSVSI